MKLSYVFVLLLAFSTPAFAIAVDSETLPDAAQESRARTIMSGLRCLVCQNQSIEISDAELAGDLRRIVRERIAAGDSDDQVRAHLVARYGDWVLMRPPLKLSTLALWGGPPLLLIVGGITLWLGQRRKAPEVITPLSQAEAAHLAKLTRPD